MKSIRKLKKYPKWTQVLSNTSTPNSRNPSNPTNSINPSNLKILHIIDSGGLYGAEMVLLNLVAEQIKMDLDPTIASIGEKHISEKLLETEALKRGFRVVKFRMFPGPNPYGMFKVLRYAQQNEFSILHSHGYKGNVAFGLMPKRLRKLPLISTLHGWTSVSGFSKNRVYEWLDLISLKYIDAVVLVNKAMLSIPKLRNLNGKKLHVVNNGIPISEAQFVHSNNTQLDHSTNKPLDQRIIDFCNKGFTIGSIGRLSEEKGFRFLIEALSLLVKENIDARLVIIGEGHERSFLEALMTQFKLTSRFMLPGYIDNAKHYMPYFNTFVLSSLTEGLPITLLEAMQAKVPIIATKVGGIPEILQDGKDGLTVEPHDSQSLARALSHIYHDLKLRNKLISFAYQKLINYYTSEKMSLQYIGIYRKLCSSNIKY